MKVQTLNKNQQVKLLELCNEFFPNYRSINLEMLDDFQSETFLLEFISHKELYGFKARTVVPWYQLCLTELPKRIGKLINMDITNYYSLSNFLNELINSKEHPVNFLWNFVQEAK